MPHKTWAIGEEVIAVDFGPIVSDQVVAQFASAAARTAGWASPPIGACSTLADHPGALYVYDGASWRSVGGGGEVAHAAMTAPQTLTGNPFDILALNVSWNANPTRIYRTELTLPVVTNNHTAAVSSFWAITNRTPLTVLREATLGLGPAMTSSLIMSLRETGLSGPVDRGVRFMGAGVNNLNIGYSLTQYGEIRVIDEGST